MPEKEGRGGEVESDSGDVMEYVFQGVGVTVK